MGKRSTKLAKEEFFRKIFHMQWKDGKQYQIMDVPYNAENEFIKGAINSIFFRLSKKDKEETPIDEFLYQCYCFYIDEIEPLHKKNLETLSDLLENFKYSKSVNGMSPEREIRHPINDGDCGFIIGGLQKPRKNRDIFSVFYEALGRWKYIEPKDSSIEEIIKLKNYIMEIENKNRTYDKRLFIEAKEIYNKNKGKKPKTTYSEALILANNRLNLYENENLRDKNGQYTTLLFYMETAFRKQFKGIQGM